MSDNNNNSTHPLSLNLAKDGLHRNSEAEEFMWYWATISLGVLLGTIVIGTIIGNISVLLHFSKRLRKPQAIPPTQFFVANLSFADLSVGVLVLPFLASWQVTGNWYFGQTFCIAWVCTHYTLCAASILSTCAICIERFIGVRFPLRHSQLLTRPRICLALACVWILAIVPSAIRVFAWTYPPTETHYQCVITQRLGHAILGAVVIFYFPAIIMVTLYTYIYTIAVGHMKLMLQKRSQNTITTKPSISEGTTSSTDPGMDKFTVLPLSQSQVQANQRMEKKQVDLARKLSILVAVVLVSYGPYFTLILLKAINPGLVNQTVFEVFAWIRYFNSFLNPFIYAYAVPAYNQAFRKSFIGRRLTFSSRSTVTVSSKASRT